MNNIHLHPVTTADAPFLTELMNHPTILRRLHQNPTTQSDWDEAISLWLSDPDEEGYILFENSHPIGWFALNGLQSSIPYLKIAVILPDYQGHGIGQRILQELLSMLRSRGYTTIRLFTDCDNQIAHACYQKCGFQIIATTKESWPDGTNCQQYEMELIL